MMLRSKELLGKLLFTDEKVFQNSSNHPLRVRRKNGSGYQSRNLLKRKKPTVKCMIWLYIGPFGKGDIFIAENEDFYDSEGKKIKTSKDGELSGFNNKSYVHMIENLAIPSMNRKIMDFVFVQDNSKVHTALINKGKTIFDVFRRNQIEYLDWPANSPDLHPVENAHKILQDEVNKELDRLIVKPKNKFQLFKTIKKCWYEKVDNKKIVKIYFSFEDRCKLCLINEGNNNFSTKTSEKTNKIKLRNFRIEDFI